MKHLFKVLLGLIVIFGVAGMAAEAMVPMNPDGTARTSKTVKLPGITHVMVSGPMHLKITAGAKRTYLVIKGSREIVHATNVQIHGNQLSLVDTDRDVNAEPLVMNLFVKDLQDLSANHITSLYVMSLRKARANVSISDDNNVKFRGKFIIPKLNLSEVNGFYTTGLFDIGQLNIIHSDKIILNGLHCTQMRIQKSDSGILKMRGYVNMIQLNENDQGKTDLRWLDSVKTQINLSGHSQLKIAGVTKKLEANLSDSAVLHARFSKAQEAYVTTTDGAKAFIQPLKKLFAKASDESQINYYSRPKKVVQYHGDRATILGLK